MSLITTAVFLLFLSLVTGQESSSDAEKASVHCASKEITVFINKTYLREFKLSDLRLSDTSCPDRNHGAENATHFIIRVPLVGCGTESSESSKSILYSNQVRQRPVANEVINRLSILRMPFTCAYPKEASASLQQMRVSAKEEQVKEMNGKGGFNLQMTIFKDEAFSQGYGPADFPLAIGLNTPLYVQLAVDSPDDRLSIIADSCYATPTPNPQDTSKYYVIEDRCPTDSTYRRYDGPGNIQQFSFNSFKFVNGDSAHIYLHCKVFVCNSTDSNSPCAQGCGSDLPSKRRQRRAVAQGLFRLDKGPINFVSEGEQVQQNSNFAMSQATTWVLVAMAAVCVLCVVGVTFSRYQLKAFKRKTLLDRETNV